MKFKVGCDLTYKAWGPSLFILNIQAARTEGQAVLEETLTVTPEIAVEAFETPATGNRCLRFEAAPGPVRVHYEAVVELTPVRGFAGGIPEMDIAKVPPQVLAYLHPSRYCESDRLGRLASAEFGHMEPGHDRVQGVCNWIYRQLGYLPGSSDRHTSAMDSLVDRVGVCRDFAHLGVALCRSLGIPARYVSVYAWRLDPPDFHAVFEAYLGGRWFLFDPTRHAAIEGLVRIGVGRDAAEVAFADVTNSVDPLDMEVSIEALDGPDWYIPTVDAISLSAD